MDQQTIPSVDHFNFSGKYIVELGDFRKLLEELLQSVFLKKNRKVCRYPIKRKPVLHCNYNCLVCSYFETHLKMKLVYLWSTPYKIVFLWDYFLKLNSVDDCQTLHSNSVYLCIFHYKNIHHKQLMLSQKKCKVNARLKKGKQTQTNQQKHTFKKKKKKRVFQSFLVHLL